MTAQIPDHVVYQGTRYDLVEADGTALFDPAEHGLQVRMIHTACWRGYICTYEVKRGRLILSALQLGIDAPPEKLFGMKVNTSSGVVYQPLDEPQPFTGSMLLGADFIRELYVHMGFAPAWKYAQVLRLTFENGALTDTEDLSEDMAQRRREIG